MTEIYDHINEYCHSKIVAIAAGVAVIKTDVESHSIK